MVLGTRVTRWQCRIVAVWRAMRVLGAPVSDLVFCRNRKNPRPCTLVPGGWPLLAAARQRSIESRYAIYVSQEAFLAFIETHSVSGRDCRLKSEESRWRKIKGDGAIGMERPFGSRGEAVSQSVGRLRALQYNNNNNITDTLEYYCFAFYFFFVPTRTWTAKQLSSSFAAPPTTTKMGRRIRRTRALTLLKII